MKIKVQVVIESDSGDTKAVENIVCLDRGKLRLNSMRFFHCGCQSHATRTFSPLAQLLTERTAPELQYLETKFASLMSYGLTVDILQEVLPLGKTINAATIRNHVHAVGQRMETGLGNEKAFFIDGCEYDWE
jgi:hypothetical protein